MAAFFLGATSNALADALPGGLGIALAVYLLFDFAIVVLLFAMIFKFLPDAKIRWRDVWIGAVMTALLFGIGKWALGLYLGSGAAASVYGAASSLITLLLWIYYSSQILLFGAEFTQVYADQLGHRVKPSEYAVVIEKTEVERPRAKDAAFISSLAQRPGIRDDNSPAFQRWDWHPEKIESRTGTKEASDWPQRTGRGSSVPGRDLVFFCDREPSVKTLGYFQSKRR